MILIGKFLLTEGFPAIVHQGVLDEAANFLQKPFAPDSLAQKVREVLDRERDKESTHAIMKSVPGAIATESARGGL